MSWRNTWNGYSMCGRKPQVPVEYRAHGRRRNIGRDLYSLPTNNSLHRGIGGLKGKYDLARLWCRARLGPESHDARFPPVCSIECRPIQGCIATVENFAFRNM